jgi:hypothetical protein
MLMNMKSLLAVLISLLFALAVAGCWDPDNPIRAGRNGAGVPARPSHNANLGGYLHAPGYCQPLQNCAQCHGSNLRGGTSGEPSCYECHDAKWAEGECGD